MNPPSPNNAAIGQTTVKPAKPGANGYRSPKTALRPLPVFRADGTIETDGKGNEIYQWHKRGPNGEWILVAVGPLRQD
jgi:hypothetical protein